MSLVPKSGVCTVTLLGDPGLLGCDNMPLTEWFLTFQTNNVPSSSNIK